MTMRHVVVAGLVNLSLAAATFSTPAIAQQFFVRPCGPDAPGLISHLEKEYRERPEAVAFTASGKLVYVLVNPETRTYSIVTVAPNNEGCLINDGYDWEWLEDKP